MNESADNSQSENNSSNNVQTEVSTTENESSVMQTEVTESSETVVIEESEIKLDVVSEPEKKNSKILICYFSFPETDGTDASSSASRVVINGEMKGAMQYMAEIISDTTGGDLFRIETVQEYPGTHEPLVDQAANEKADSARPELLTHIDNLDDYDTIFIGYPNWWADMPMPLYTFLEEYDLSEKTIIPFNSHGGSRFSNTIETIASYEPSAEVITDGFTVSRDDVVDVKADLVEWVRNIGY
ncbi:MAG: flavodoxin [Lachnospiraceae bacterium]|nr:flavodoxin [Lachnospiraceae bacterium]